MSKRVEDLPQECYDVAWSFFEREQGAIRALCRRYCRGQDVVCELQSECTYRLPYIVNTYIVGSSASLRTHVFANLKWYLWKLMNARARHGQQYEHVGEHVERLDSVHVPQVSDASDEVQSILDAMPPYERSILVLYHLCGMTLPEISGVIDVSYGTARVHYKKSLQLAQQIAASRSLYNFAKQCSIFDALSAL